MGQGQKVKEGSLPNHRKYRNPSFDKETILRFVAEMKRLIPILLFPVFGLMLFLGGCAQFQNSPVYDSPAYKPHDPSKVVVKVSLSKQMVYVMEGRRPLLVTACCVGVPSHPTPKGNFSVLSKQRNKRSGEYGFAVLRNAILPCEASNAHGHYVGYPMPYYVEFTPGYGFHLGWVWPVPKSHGCIRIHANDAGKFFALVRIGTPVRIANAQAEDETLGANFKRPSDYGDPELPLPLLTAQRYFEQLKPDILQ